MFVFSTGSSGTIGRNLPAAVIPLPIRLNEEIELGPKRDQLIGSSVIHLAGIVGISAANSNPSSRRINLDYTFEFARQALEAGISKFVYVSSSHVYSPSEEVVNELSNLEPVSLYGEQKLEAEQGLLEIFSRHTERLVIARVFSLLDLGMPSYSLGGLAEKIMKSKTRVNVHNSNDVRDFMDLRSCAKALYQLASNQTQNQVYNICSGKKYSVRDAITSIVEANGGSTTQINFVPENSNRPYQCGSNERFTREFPDASLGWKYAPK